MAIQNLNLGASPDDDQGDSLREGGAKINANFAETVEKPASADAGNLPSFADAEGKALADSGIAASDVVKAGDDATRLGSGAAAAGKVLESAGAGQPAVWGDKASVTGLTNPLTEGLNANDRLLYSAVFAGFRDRYYNLETDSADMIESGVATLTPVYNAYYHPNLDTALEIVLPDHDSQAAGNALFGIISVRLGESGSLSISQDVPWQWEKGSASEEDPVIPTGDNVHFRVRYSWDLISESYAVSISHLSSISTTSGQVSYVDGSITVSDLAKINKDTHEHTHTWTSETQDGTVYALVFFFADGTGEATPPAGLTPITNPPTGGGTQVQGLAYYYKPSQADLNGGTTDFDFVKTSEMGYVAVLEVQGAHATDPVGGTAFDRSSSSVRTVIGPVTLHPVVDGCLLFALAGHDTSSGTGVLDITTSNGFTAIAENDSIANYDPSWQIAAQQVSEAGEYDTPIFTTSGAAGSTQLEAFWLVPNE